MRADADFAAAFAEGKDFAGIERSVRIEGVVDAAHEIEIGVGEKERHELRFFHADAVLAGKRAADFDAVTDNFGGGSQGAFELRFVAGIVKNDGMKIPVAGVENVADVKTVVRADFLDAAERLRKFCAGNDAVENVVAGSKAAESAESVFAAFPEEFALGVVASDADFAGVMSVADFGDGGGLGGDGFGEAFDFEEQNGGTVARKSGVYEIFDSSKSPAVKHFASRGSDSAGGDVDNRFRGVVHGIENGEERLDGFGFAGEFYRDFGDEGERAFGADEETREIVAGSIAVPAADADDFTIGENEFESGDMIGGDTVGQRMRAAGVFRDVAADSAGFLAGGIGSKIEAVRLGGAGEFEIDDAGLDDGALIFRVKSEDAIHAGEDDHDATGASQCAAGESGAGTTPDNGNVELGGDFDDARNVLCGSRKDDEVRAAFFDGAVVFVEEKIFRPGKNGERAEEFFEFANEAREHRAHG